MPLALPGRPCALVCQRLPEGPHPAGGQDQGPAGRLAPIAAGMPQRQGWAACTFAPLCIRMRWSGLEYPFPSHASSHNMTLRGLKKREAQDVRNLAETEFLVPDCF